MFSPFTFSISVPGTINPFSRSPDPSNSASASLTPVSADQPPPGRPWLRRPHPSSLPPPVPLARKRGWQPSNPEPSLAATIATSTSGYLDIHPKYCDPIVTQEPRKEDEGSMEMIAGGYYLYRITHISGCINTRFTHADVIYVNRLLRLKTHVPRVSQ
jgi:hypothetical protein